MRAALIIDLFKEDSVGELHKVLKTNYDGTQNFDVEVIYNETPSKRLLNEKIEQLFAIPSNVSLLYIRSRVVVDDGKLFIINEGSLGTLISLESILNRSSISSSKELIIVFDCISSHLESSRYYSYFEGYNIKVGQSLLCSFNNKTFSPIFVEALDSLASDLVGNVSVAGIYNIISRMQGAWDTSPIFITKRVGMQNLRRCEPKIDMPILRSILSLFSDIEDEIWLDPSYEPASESPDVTPEKVKKFRKLQALRAASLISPNGTDHMYYAAMESKSCQLTALGKYYWKLAKKGLL